ncbi:unnamed protein product [Allacma fusca]|uniref:Telomeric repeat-binding factor 2-interacting protein 1 n=1 Tax=Allacma fusca TaxID=39272 RepID=A0A8J2Q462_9HEXA|nr:unnamed protein product [Allacma fusca]
MAGNERRILRYCPIFKLSGSVCSVFKIYPEESENETIQAYVELGGGHLLQRDEDDPHVITIVDYDWYYNVKKIEFPQEFPAGRDYFQPRFLLDSWEDKKPADLNKYRIGPSAFAMYDARDILMRKRSWKDLSLKPVHRKPNALAGATRRDITKGEQRLEVENNTAKTPTKRKLEVAGQRVPDGKVARVASENINIPSKSVKSATKEPIKINLVAWKPPDGDGKTVKRKPPEPYTREEGQAILDFINKNNYHASISGIKIWKQLESRKVCQNRSYQSLKEHFRKKVLPNLKKYECSERNLNKFRLGEKEKNEGRRKEARLHQSDESSDN